MNTQARHLRIDIISDVVCPWCIIGYKQLLKALDSRPGPFNIDLHWHPFEINPNMPPEGQNLREHLAGKYGTTPEQSQQARKRLTDLGNALGFTFNYQDDMRVFNTFRAHQLLHWAAEKGQQTALKLQLFKTFFSDNQDVSDIEVLSQAAEQCGLPMTEAETILKEQRYASEVREEQQKWIGHNIQAVPTFVFNHKYQVTGAQDAETFGRLLDQLSTELAA